MLGNVTANTKHGLIVPQLSHITVRTLHEIFNFYITLIKNYYYSFHITDGMVNL